MVAIRHLDRPKRNSSGAYTISGTGISTSAPTFGSALSKAQSIAARIQREIRKQDEAIQHLYVRRIGEEKLLARIDVHPQLIETYAAVGANK